MPNSNDRQPLNVQKPSVVPNLEGRSTVVINPPSESTVPAVDQYTAPPQGNIKPEHWEDRQPIPASENVSPTPQPQESLASIFENQPNTPNQVTPSVTEEIKLNLPPKGPSEAPQATPQPQTPEVAAHQDVENIAPATSEQAPPGTVAEAVIPPISAVASEMPPVIESAVVTQSNIETPLQHQPSEINPTTAKEVIGNAFPDSSVNRQIEVNPLEVSKSELNPIQSAVQPIEEALLTPAFTPEIEEVPQFESEQAEAMQAPVEINEPEVSADAATKKSVLSTIQMLPFIPGGDGVKPHDPKSINSLHQTRLQHMKEAQNNG